MTYLKYLALSSMLLLVYIYFRPKKNPIKHNCIVQSYNTAWNPLLSLTGMTMSYQVHCTCKKRIKKERQGHKTEETLENNEGTWKSVFQKQETLIFFVSKYRKILVDPSQHKNVTCFRAADDSERRTFKCLSALCWSQSTRMAYQTFLVCGKIKSHICRGLVSHVQVSPWALYKGDLAASNRTSLEDYYFLT